MAYHREWVHGNPRSGGTELILEHDQVVLRHAFDAQPVLDQNSRERNMPQRGSPRMGAKKAASIPTPLYHLWRKEWREKHADKWTWHTFLAMRLNSRDYSYLRTSDMKL